MYLLVQVNKMSYFACLGSGMHCFGCCCHRKKTGADESRETCT